MTEKTCNVGDVRQWSEVPDRTLVRMDLTSLSAMRIRKSFWYTHQAGRCRCVFTRVGSNAMVESPGLDDDWDEFNDNSDLVTVIALDVPADATAEHLRTLAERFEVREALCSFIRTSAAVHAAVCSFLLDERTRGRCTAEEAATRAAERLHAAGFRPREHTAADAARLLSEAR